VIDCFICAKHATGDGLGLGVVFEDDLVYASHGVVREGDRAYLGYLFVETRRHVARLGDLTTAEAAAVGVLVNDLSRVLRTAAGAEHVYSHVYGDGPPHLHVHLQPRYPTTPPEYWPRRVGGGSVGVLNPVTDWPEAPRGGPADARALTTRLSEALGTLRLAERGPDAGGS
jgi:histidine triad (HIT) family protein